ncbi:MAG: HAD family hydrolase [Balneolaceae bacterium]|nr:HAD family hydrolase [Balneolaceae bacterium]
MKPILLFDIDGTLLNVKKSFMKDLIAEILDELSISPDLIKKRSFAGRTDRDIFSELVSFSPRPNEMYEEAKKIYLQLMNENFSPADAEVIEGAREAVYRALEAGLEVGLCTGNFRESAYFKVEAAGFSDLFEFGGFGCHHEDRIHLPEQAHKNFVDIRGYEPEPQQYMIIGDTPNDIRCAKYFGAKAISVTTGSFNRDQLEKHDPDLLLENLGEVTDWSRYPLN